MTAQDFAFGVLGLDCQGTIDLVENIRSSQFHKSMTSYRSSSVRQDVYHVAHEGFVLYVKFTQDTDGFYLLISLKDK